MSPMGLDAVDEMLHNSLGDLIAEGDIVTEDGSGCLCFQQLRVEGIFM